MSAPCVDIRVPTFRHSLTHRHNPDLFIESGTQRLASAKYDTAKRKSGLTTASLPGHTGFGPGDPGVWLTGSSARIFQTGPWFASQKQRHKTSSGSAASCGVSLARRCLTSPLGALGHSNVTTNEHPDSGPESQLRHLGSLVHTVRYPKHTRTCTD